MTTQLSSSSLVDQSQQMQNTPKVQFQVLEGPQNGIGQLVNVEVPAGAGLFIQFETPDDHMPEVVDSLAQMVLKLAAAVQPSVPALAQEAHELLLAHELVSEASLPQEVQSTQSAMRITEPSQESVKAQAEPAAQAATTTAPTPMPVTTATAVKPQTTPMQKPKTGSFMGLTKPAQSTQATKPAPTITPTPAAATPSISLNGTGSTPKPTQSAPVTPSVTPSVSTQNSPSLTQSTTQSTPVASNAEVQSAKPAGKSPFKFK